MQAVVSPSPFSAGNGFSVSVAGGEPPYVVTPFGVPPNPLGVQVFPGPPARVDVPPGTPEGTPVFAIVTDSSSPPQSAIVTNRVG